MSTSVLKALPGKLDIKRHSPSILYISASLAMPTSVLNALPGKLDIKRHSPSILYLFKTKNATDIYYRQLRQAEIRNAWEHWDKLYADVIRPKKLLENFRKVYDAYSPHREEESFVVCPWKPGPFLLRSNRRKFTQSLPCTPDFMTGRFCPTIRPLSRL